MNLKKDKEIKKDSKNGIEKMLDWFDYMEDKHPKLTLFVATFIFSILIILGLIFGGMILFKILCWLLAKSTFITMVLGVAFLMAIGVTLDL